MCNNLSFAIARSTGKFLSLKCFKHVGGVAAISMALIGLFAAPVQADRTNKTTITYVRISESEGVVRVKPQDGIATPAACQTTTFMVIPLTDPLLKMKLATLYTAASTGNARVRLFGNGDCSNSPGSETITDVTLFPPQPE